MSKKSFVRSVCLVSLKKMGRNVCRFLLNKEYGINHFSDTIAINAVMFGTIVLKI